jgi:hypothetical protein
MCASYPSLQHRSGLTPPLLPALHRMLPPGSPINSRRLRRWIGPESDSRRSRLQLQFAQLRVLRVPHVVPGGTCPHQLAPEIASIGEPLSHR